MDDDADTKEINVGGQPFDLAFHPSSPLLAVGVITGQLQLFNYGDGAEPKKLWDIPAHTGSVRGLQFIEGGKCVLTVSSDHSIAAIDSETGQIAARLANAHTSPISRVVNVTETTVATGDDNGMIKIWDTRERACCSTFAAHQDFVADMEYVSQSNQLLAASGDGSLSVCNLSRKKVVAKSEFAEDELLSIVVVKNGRKVICGSQEGVLLLYSWGHFKDCSDRFVGHPHSVDALLKLDEDTILTGSSDGMIRVVSILPNKMIGVIGEHSDYPIERLAFSSDRAVLGSASHDNTVKLWDVRYLLEEDKKEDEDAVQEGLKEDGQGVPSGPVNAPTLNSDTSRRSVLVDSDEDMDSDRQDTKKRKKGKHAVDKGKAPANFFDDML